MHSLPTSHPESYPLDILTIIHYNPFNLINIVPDKVQTHFTSFGTPPTPSLPSPSSARKRGLGRRAVGGQPSAV